MNYEIIKDIFTGSYNVFGDGVHIASFESRLEAQNAIDEYKAWELAA